MQSNKQKESAFTLIELSIVLIIIGLIIGGILAGQELIKAAEARGIMAQVDRYTTAINAFKLKYNSLPGDFNNATTMIPGSIAGNGDGNGILLTGSTAASSPAKWDQEDFYFWNHLSGIGVVEGSYSGVYSAGAVLGTVIPYLKNNRGGIIAYGASDNSNYYHMGVAGTTTAITSGTSTISSVGVFLPDTAYAIDVKIDDGVANTGKVLAMSGIDVVPTAGTTACVSVAATYNLTNSPGYVCQLKYKLQ